MNSSDLEARLRALSPSPPPPAVRLAIASELATRPPSGSTSEQPGLLQGALALLRGMAWAGGGAAAVLILQAQTRAPARPSPQPAWESVGSLREELPTERSGVVVVAETIPAEYVRSRVVDRRLWANSATGAQLEITLPREDVHLLPISFQ